MQTDKAHEKWLIVLTDANSSPMSQNIAIYSGETHNSSSWFVRFTIIEDVMLVVPRASIWALGCVGLNIWIKAQN